MKMAIEKVRAETLRLKLHCPPGYLAVLDRRPDVVDHVANGVGSETSWTYHITPDTVWGLNINPTSHCHDWMYTFPLYFPSVALGLAWKHLADRYFGLNGHIQAKDGTWLLQGPRTRRINAYAAILSAGGSEAFWAQKPLPPDYNFFYSSRPDYDHKVVARFMEIEQIIHSLCPEYRPYQPSI